MFKFNNYFTAVLTSLNHCLEIIVQKEDGLKKKLDREIDKRKKVEEELK